MRQNTNSIIVKVCGMRDINNIREVLSLSPDYMGFIFYPESKRFVADLDLSSTDFGNTRKVGVFVNADVAFIREHVETYELDGIQLHGDESPAFCAAIKVQFGDLVLIKALRISTKKELEDISSFDSICDLLVLDSAGAGYGGHGIQWDHRMLQEMRIHTPFLLSGGIDASFDVSQLNKIHPMCQGVDINSRFEIEPAYKDIKLLKIFLDGHKV